LLNDAAAAPLAVHEIDVSAVEDRFWITVQGPLRQQAAALQRLQQLMAEFPDVDVDLGTILA
jgi:hypothetical protein